MATRDKWLPQVTAGTRGHPRVPAPAGDMGTCGWTYHRPGATNVTAALEGTRDPPGLSPPPINGVGTM